MSHCRGCGGHFDEGPHAKFEHILGCGWVKGKEDGRRAPSGRETQRSYIIEGLQAAWKAKDEGEREKGQAEAFMKAVLVALERYN